MKITYIIVLISVIAFGSLVGFRQQMDINSLRVQVQRLQVQMNPQNYSAFQIEAVGLNPEDYGWHSTGPIYLGDLGPGESVSVPMTVDFTNGSVKVDTNGIVHHNKK